MAKLRGGSQAWKRSPQVFLLLLSSFCGLGSIGAARLGGVSKATPSGFVEEMIAPIEQFGTVGRELLGECTDPTIPNACYASDGSFAICCPAQCGPFSDGYNPTCGRYGVDPAFNWGVTSARPMSTSGECPAEAPNPCFTADSSAGFCCGASGCGPSGPNPVCNGDATISEAVTTSNPTPAPTSTSPSTPNPTPAPTSTSPSTSNPTPAPTSTPPSTSNPTPAPTSTSPSTSNPSSSPTGPPPTLTPTSPPTSAPTTAPTNSVNTPAPTTNNPTPSATTATVKPGDKRTFVLHNLCPESIWIGIFWNADKQPITLANTGQATTGFELGSQASAGVLASSDWIGRFWARTRCGGSPFRCETGDCGGGTPCSGRTGEPPASLAEFALSQADGQDFFDASLVDGYNLKLVIKPSNPACAAVGCSSDLLATCPESLKMRSADGSRVIGCYSACSAPAMQSDPLREQYCCSGKFAEDPHGCQALHPDQYTTAFKAACPSAYSYAYDDPTSLFACNNSNYDIYFCGDVPLTA
ncbi:Pathogenesis-related thaumatin superfamily protein [Klebsormidium nitens]|uniref:Pathogenesis-related thaumatin superfamily protein n=1 Tax=Klebsormidium nitens TaxID=105231 RepID=A0A1Y1HSG8_KLENI|nr:Pathogenesis-related thaumatin superfamily protein [Klebsormidium nitens]|eukprot:GAQ81575.1 Pathogenesis-related thaumatin superfamily protein [Klebsormidium nitens]